MTAKLSGRLLAAGRALAGISGVDLANAAGLDIRRLQFLEAGGAAWLPKVEAQRLSVALEEFGVVILPEGDGMGAGLRLKFTRLDAERIEELEGEGGPARPDNAP